MKSKLQELLKDEKIKDSIVSRVKCLQIMLTASYQYDADLFARVCERVDDVFDYILDNIMDNNEHAE